MTTTPDYRALCAELTEHLALLDEPPHELVCRARALLATTVAVDGICTGCDAPRHKAIAAVARGGIACCPDCSTLTVADRNAIREAVAQRAAPEAVGVPTDWDIVELWAEAAGMDTSGFDTQHHAFAHLLLTRYAHPAPVPVGYVRYEFSVYDGEDEEQAGGSAPTLQDVIREGQHYLAIYGCGHRLELREVRTLPDPQP
jgi:hypothetical protein